MTTLCEIPLSELAAFPLDTDPVLARILPPALPKVAGVAAFQSAL